MLKTNIKKRMQYTMKPSVKIDESKGKNIRKRLRFHLNVSNDYDFSISPGTEFQN